MPDPTGDMVGPSRLRLVLCVVLCCTLLWVSLGVTFSFTIGRSRPDIVLVVWPWSARAKAAQAATLATDVVARGERGDAALSQGYGLAVSALRREPVNVMAARTLGLLTQLQAKPQEARRWFDQAERLSRRDLPTQLWLIEEAVNRGNVKEALVHYDRALRTSADAEGELLPILKASAELPDVAEALGGTLARRPNWRMPFLLDLTTSMRSGPSLVRLVSAARLNLQNQADKEVVENALRRLLAMNDIRSARRLYAIYRPDGARGQLIADPDFDQDMTLQPFGWALGVDPDMTAERDRNEKGQSFLSVRSSGASGGVVASQLLILDPGSYRAEAVFSTTAAGGNATPSLMVTCIGSDVRATIRLPTTNGARSRVSLPFHVQPGCKQQQVAITVAASSDVDAQFYRIDVTRVR